MRSSLVGLVLLCPGIEREKGMRDWSMHELEDIVWEGSAECSDHIVPCWDGKQVNESQGLDDAHKKPRHEVRNDVEKSIYLHTIPRSLRSVASEKAVPVLRDPVRTSNATALASWDAGSSDDYVKNCNMGSPKNLSLGTNVAADDDKGYHFSQHSSPVANDPGLLENGYKDGENDLMDYDWSDIGNFEDIDTLFSDATFGRGTTGTADELTWFSSSSCAIYGSEDTFELGLQSPCSELSALNSRSGAYGANTNLLPEKGPETAYCNDLFSFSCQSYVDWLDNGAHDKEAYANKEKIDMHTKQLESQHSSLENGNDQASKYTSGNYLHGPGPIEQIADQMILPSSVSAPQIYSSQFFSNQNHVESPSSSKGTSSGLHTKLGCGLLTDQVPFTSAMLTAKLENGTSPTSIEVSDHVINHVPYCMNGVPDHLFMSRIMEAEGPIEKLPRTPTKRPSQMGGLASMAPVGKRHYKFQYKVGEDNEKENQTIEHPTVEADTTVQENSSMTSEYCDDLSAEATSFWQLQDAMHQLDVKTKLCIRDSLYRLARSAEQRHSTASMNGYSRGRGDNRGVQGTEASKNRVKLIDAGGDTNPLDRSIAHLLFCSPSETGTRMADDTTSLESHIIVSSHKSLGPRIVPHCIYLQNRSILPADTLLLQQNEQIRAPIMTN